MISLKPRFFIGYLKRTTTGTSALIDLQSFYKITAKYKSRNIDSIHTSRKIEAKFSNEL